MTVMTVPFPFREEDITAAWLQQALAQCFPGIAITHATCLQKISGTATKLRYGLDYAPRKENPALPQSLWAKSGFASAGAAQGDAFINEVFFFRDIAPLLSANMPRCYYGAVDLPSRNGVLLLEDLINRQARFGGPDMDTDLTMVRAILDLQASYHAAFWKSDTLDRFSWLKRGGTFAETRMVQQYFGLWDGAQPLPRFEYVQGPLRERAQIEAALTRLVDGMAADALCLVHGDSHIANLFFEPDGRPGYLDWQHVMRANWAFDMVNFLITALDIETRRAEEQNLLRYYLDALARHGAEAPDFATAWRDYRRYALWSFMWAMCPPTVHPEALCTRNTARACAAISDLQSLAALDA